MRSNKGRETTIACIARCKVDKWKLAIEAVGEEQAASARMRETVLG